MGTATVGKIKADLILSTGQFKRDSADTKADLVSLGAVIRERKVDFTMVESAAKQMAAAAKQAAQEARNTANEQAAAARAARQAAQEAAATAKELATAAKNASDEEKQEAQERATAAKQAAKDAKDAAQQQAELARSARQVAQEQSQIAKEANKVAADAKKAAKEQANAIKEQADAAEELKKKLEEQDEVITNLGAAGTATFAALVAGIAKAVKQAAEFQQQMADLKSGGGVSAEELNQASDAAMKFGPAVGKLSEAGEALNEFQKAGFDLSRLTKGELKDALDLMTAGELNAGDAAKYASGAVSIYANENLKLKTVADIAVGAANASATSVSEMTQANAALGSVAAQVGISFEDVNTALALFANNGMAGSDAGTSLKTTILALVNPTSQQQKVMQDLGLQFFDSSGKMKSFGEIAEMLQSKLAKYNDQSKELILSTLAGSDGVRALSVLAKSGADGFDQMNKAMQQVSASDSVTAKMDTMNGSFQKLQAEVGVAAIKFGQDFTPALASVVGWVEKLINSYNSLDESTRKNIDNSIVVGTAMLGTVSVLSLLTVGFGKLSAAIKETGGAMALLERHPIVLALTAVIGVVTAVIEHYSQAAAEAREFAQAQDDLNKTIENAKTTTNQSDFTDYQKKAQAIADLGKKYEDLKSQDEAYRQKLVELSIAHKDMSHEAVNTRTALGKVEEGLKSVKDEMSKAGVTNDDYKSKLQELKNAWLSNTSAVIEYARADLEQAAQTQDNINKIQEAKQAYDELSQKESLSADEKSKLAESVNTLRQLVPGLSAVQKENGQIVLQNTGLISDQVLALQQQKKQSSDTANGVVNDSIRMAEATLNSINQQIKAYEALQAARDALSHNGDSTDDPTVTDNQRFREQDWMDRLNAQAAASRAEIAKAKELLNEAANGTIKPITTNSSGGGDTYTVPGTPEKNKTADQLAKEADQAMQERYQAELDAAKHAVDVGLITRGQYIEKLKSIEQQYSGWLKQHQNERYSIEEEIGKESFQNSSDWVAQRKQQMQDEGKAAQEIAQMEIDAWTRVTQRHNLMAEDQKTAEANLAAARHDLESATFQSSVDWIAKNEAAMKSAGASELDVAEATYQAWTRVNARRGQGVYTIEDEKRATDELATATQNLTQALEAQLQKDREMDRDASIKSQEEANKKAEDAIQAKIDALDKQASAQKAVNDLIDQQNKLLELQSERDQVAADKRFELITRDADGNLVRTLSADTSKLTDLDKQIADQQKTITQTKLDQQLQSQKDELAKELAAQQKSDKDKMDALNAYWNEMTSQERITQDVRNSILQDGLDKSMQKINAYTTAVVSSYQSAQAQIMSLGGASLPSAGTINAGTSAGSTTYTGDPSKGYVPASPTPASGGYTGDPTKGYFPSMIAQLAAAVGAVPTSTQRMASAVMAVTAQPSLSFSAQQKAAIAGASSGGSGPTFNTGGAPLIGAIHSNATDPKKVADEVMNRLESEVWSMTTKR